MEKKQKKLLENLVSTFLILLSSCLFIALLIILKFQESCPEVIIGMLGVCATLYAPIAAFFFYDSWKEQTKYSKKLDFLLEIRQELRLTSEQIFRLRNFICFDYQIIISYDEKIIESQNNKYIENIKEIDLKIKNIKDLFIDIYFITNIPEETQYTIHKNLNYLKEVLIQCRKMHDHIYKLFLKKETLQLINYEIKKNMAYYNSTYDGITIKNAQGNDVEIDIEMNIAKVNSSLYYIIMEIIEPGSTKDLTLKQRLLLKY